jgi:SAM-dependent methyltransferase
MSNDWTAGYVADIGYTYGYYGELNPLRAQLAFLNAGLVPPGQGTACELGFGQGISINVHATASTTAWYGTDFNPSQAGFAQTLAQSAGHGAQLFDESFAEFAQRDLPQFDYIGLHGIWTWISDENRPNLVDFLRRKLKVGGVVYISYNTLPGWAKFAPVRQLMAQHAKLMNAEGAGAHRRTKDALAFVDGLMALNPLYAAANEGVEEKIASIKAADPSYLAHEYFNQHWVPMYFSEMDQWLSSAKLSYACSAQPVDHIAAINLTADQQKYLRDIPNQAMRETTRDFMLNTQFRRDYWVKGARQLSVYEQLSRLRALRVVLLVPVDAVKRKIKVVLGEADLSDATCGPLLRELANQQPKSLGELEAAMAGDKVPFTNMVEAIMLLAGSDQLALAQDEEVVERARPHCDDLNRTILARALAGGEILTLASPVTGGGIAMNWLEQLFLLARDAGRSEPAQWAEHAWKVLRSLNQNVLKDGKALLSPEDNLAYLQHLSGEFKKRLPVLDALKVLSQRQA